MLKPSSSGQEDHKAYITTLLFGLGKEEDHKYASKCLTNELLKLGLSISPSEVTRLSTAIRSKESDGGIMLKGSLTHWVADNVDHNICTLDEKDTFSNKFQEIRCV